MGTKKTSDATPSLAALRAAGFLTLNEAMVALEIVRAERDGSPHTIGSLKNAVGLPLASTSRIAWDFVQRGFGHQENAATDRRVRVVRADLKKFDRAVQA